MTPETTEFIGETIGPVIKSNDPMEMKGGTFMRVRVMVDVTRPLCRGGRICFDEEAEGWVALQYEPLPIFVSGVECYRTTTRTVKYG